MNRETPISKKELLTYAIHLGQKEFDAIGFLPKVALQEYNDRHQIIPAVINNEPAGYALFYDGRNGNPPKRHPATIRIHQIAVQDDARRVLIATDLIRQVIAQPRLHHFDYLEAWVAFDLPANAFWHALKFDLIAQRLGGATKSPTATL